MPSDGRFFESWSTDCYASTQACLEAGRSPCDPDSPGPNKRVVTVPAATWNAWLGSSGGSMNVALHASSGVYSAPDPTRSLALYCENLGINLCPSQSCSGLCGPGTFTRVTIAYTSGGCQSNGDCDDGEFCTIDTCNVSTGQCSYAARNCSDGNSCTTDSCNESTNHCVNTNNSNSCNDGLYCNGSDTCGGGSCSMHSGNPCGSPGCCDETNNNCALTIVSSDPPNGAIDAREPFDPDGSNPAGWDSIELTMSGVPGDVSAGDFSISTTGGTAPNIVGLGINQNVVTLDLDTFIPVGEWTQVTHDCSGASVCLGYLPADADASGASNATDVLEVVDCLNGIITCSIWQCDADRSDVCTSTDVLTVIDLLNGAGAYDPWLDVFLPANPCNAMESFAQPSDAPMSAEAVLLAVAETNWSDEFDGSEMRSILESLAKWVVATVPEDERQSLAN